MLRLRSQPRIAAFVFAITCGHVQAGAAQPALPADGQSGQQGGVVVWSAGAASGQVPPRDQPSLPATGTSRIRGRVVAADTGRPLRRAIVRLNGPGGPESRSTTTNQDGQYEFTQLPAAQYSIVASKSGYVQMVYGQTRPGSVSRPLSLGERENREGINFILPPGGVITGRVVDEYGEAASEVIVSAQRQLFINGARRPVNTGTPSSSNDIGEFRIYGLPPGDYYVVATPRGQTSPFDSSIDRTAYGQTYYPSATDSASAQRVTVRSGDTLSNIVVALTPTTVVRVSGTVIGSDGRPVSGGRVNASPRSGFGPGSANGVIRPDGTFTIASLTPGEYLLRAFPPAAGGSPVAGPSVLTASITVDGTDLTNVVLMPQTPTPIAGRLTGDPVALAQVQPQRTRIMAVPSGNTAVAGPVPPQQALRDDLSFESFAYPGQSLIRPTGLTGLVIRAVRLNGQDVTSGFDVEQGVPITDLEVEVTNALGKLAVTTTNARGEVVVDRDIVVFPQDETRWGMGSQMPGHAAAGRTDEQGHYDSPPLLAGSYYVAAPEALEPGQVNDPEYLESLRVRAERITLGASETATVLIRLTER